MYKLELLRMFVTTEQTGSFSACARQLGKAQSAVSQGIATLEIDLNIQLFDRSTRKPRLTVEGLRLLPYAQAVIQQNQEFELAASAIDRQDETNICLAIDSALVLDQLGHILLDFSVQFPATSLDIQTQPSNEIAALVQQQKADIGLMFSDMSFKREVDLSFVGNLPVCAVCAPSHDLARLQSVEIAHLILHRQVVAQDQSSQHFPAISAQVWRSNNFHCAMSLLKQGLGWGYMPIHLVDRFIGSGELHSLAMRLDDKPWNPPVDCVTQKGIAMGKAQQYLCSAIKQLLE